MTTRIFLRFDSEVARLRHFCRRSLLKLRLSRLRLLRKVEVSGPCHLDAPLIADGGGVVTLASNVFIGYHLAPCTGAGEIRLQARYPASRISLGDSTVLSNNVTIIAVESVEIGPRCQIGDHTLIFDSDFHHSDSTRRNAPNPPTARVSIEQDVWIGSRVTILKGVRIGARSIIAAGAVVTSSIPPDSIAAGVPAKVIKSSVDPATRPSPATPVPPWSHS